MLIITARESVISERDIMFAPITMDGIDIGLFFKNNRICADLVCVQLTVNSNTL